MTDAAANGYAIYGLHGGHAREKVGHALVTLIAVSGVAAVPAIAPWLRGLRDADPVRPR